MRYYWVKDRIQQKQFILKWKPGKDNKGDYYTKRHPPSHCKKMRPFYLYMPKTQSQQGCVEEQTVLLKNILLPKATKISYPVNKTGGKTY